MTDAERKAQREKWENDHYSKLIDCPAHPGAHWAILYEWGHQHGGYYECPRGDFEEHEHDDYQIEEAEHLSPNPDSSYYWVEKYYACGICGAPIDHDVADPEQDRQDAIDDAAIMEALGK